MEELAAVYSRSLFEVARETGKLDVAREQLGQFTDLLRENRQVAVFFFSPYCSTQEKKDGLHKAVTGAEPIIINFLELLIENHRMPVLFRVRAAFEELWEAENQLLPVHITSAVVLDEATTRAIGEQIGQRTGRRVQLSSEVEPEILGGIILRVGNSILDASIRNRLERLRKQVARAA
ncbi:MAG TPA: ATP synthase F1 subunit delta [Solirubrobacteraceae bacterium]|jgi:ATP synthase F1 delta subunit|nr:ATP synthase F1 subunit delta [Solirubrobacteraceae bacterium]